jgi:hypothetical protein
MSNQELHNQGEIKEEADVQKRRRFIKGAGIAAPVVLSLANRSAFGAAQQCLSQQVSGNMSHVGANSCASGYSPTLWRNPSVGTAITKLVLVSNIASTTTLINKRVTATFTGSAPAPGTSVNIVRKRTTKTQTYRWAGTSFTYGILTTTKISTKITKVSGGATVTTPILITAVTAGGTGTVTVGQTYTTNAVWEYTGAIPANTLTISNPDTTVSPLPAPSCSDFTGGTAFNVAFGYGVTTAMRAILCADVNSEASHCVAALLNATFTPSINYVATVAQVKSLCATPGSPYPANYSSLSNFWASTW